MESFRIPFDDTPARKVDSLAQRYRSAAQDVKKYEQTIKAAAAGDKQLTALQVRGYGQSVQRLEALKSEIQAEKEKGKAFADTSRELRQTERAGMRLRRVFGDVMFQKIANGQPIEFADVARTALYSDRAILAVGKAVGASEGALGTLSRLHPFIFLAVEAAIRASQIPKQMRDDKNSIDLFREERRLGTRSREERDAIIKATTPGFVSTVKATFGTNIVKETLENLDKKSGTLSGMTAQEIDDEMKTALKKRSRFALINNTYGTIRDENGRLVNGLEVKRREADAVFAAKAKYGVDQLPEDLEVNAIRSSHVGLTIGTDTLDKAMENAAVRAARKKHAFNPNREFHEAFREKMYRTQFDIFSKRVPANPTE